MATSKVNTAKKSTASCALDPLEYWREVNRKHPKRRNDPVLRKMDALREAIRKRNGGLLSDSTLLIREDRDSR